MTKHKHKPDPNKLTFLQHARELRQRILLSLASILLIFFLLMVFSEKILSLLTLPLKNLGYQLHIIKIHEAFFSTLRISFFTSVIVSSPIWLWMLIGFVIPALSKKQKIIFFFISIFCIIFLISGFLFSYYLLIPISLRYLLSFAKEELTSVISINYYLDFFLILFFATGVGFQLPLILLFLCKINVVHYKLLAKGRRWAVIIILIVGGILTPPDIISQVGLAVPLYLLYELGIALGFIFTRKHSQKDKHEKI